MNNPESLRQIMDSPFVQQIMNSPEIIRTMLNANPQIQQLMEVCFVIKINFDFNNVL